MTDREPIGEADLLRMRESLIHRGPDDAGHFLGPGIALGSRRLAILDLSPRGHMPMNTPDSRYRIVYNGEIYNHRELRRDLEAHGQTFSSSTDTEVLLTLFAREGPAMLDRLNGMFAFAVWDSRERTLFLARDRLGIKPLYYAWEGERLYFASEEKALFAGGCSAVFDPETWEELLTFRYVAGSRTPFKGVQRLLPGHWLRWKAGAIEIQRWWNLGERARAARENPPGDPVRWFRETFDSSVSLRRISDVPVGVLLSGGLDSSSVAASLSQQDGSGLASFTMRFTEPDYDEGPLARQVAEQWGLEFHDCRLTAQQLLGRLEHASWLNDEPLAHGNDVHLFSVSEFAKPWVTVLLSGEGSDESLGGYMRYQPLRFPRLLTCSRMVVPPLVSALRLGGRWQKLRRFLGLGTLDRFVLFNSCDVLPDDLRSVGMVPSGHFAYRKQVLQDAKLLYPDEPMRQAMFSDQHTFLCSLLDRNDRMTMGASIECRVPFLDYRLVEGLAALPSRTLLKGRHTKPLLRSAVGSRLPDSVLQGRKWGFGVPWQRYLRDLPDFRDLLHELPNAEPIASGPFESAALRRMVDAFMAGDDRGLILLRQLAMVAIWYRACVQRPVKTGPRPISISAVQ